MLSNFVSINTLAPIYPKDHIDSKVELIRKHFKGMDPSEAEQLLCDLYNVKSLQMMTDAEGIISDYDYQPSLSSRELEELRVRIDGYINNYFGDISQRDQLFYVRNIVNCVPKGFDDLVDYIPTELLRDINSTYSMATKGFDTFDDYFYSDAELESFAKKQPVKTEEGVKESSVERKVKRFSSEVDSYLDVMGMIAMQSLNENSLEADEFGWTNRQRLLTRAGQYYTLARYNYTTAMLWMSQYISPQEYCSCPNHDCPGRHFGFIDAKASGELVLQSLNYIEKIMSSQGKLFALDQDVTLDEILQSDIERIVYGAESLILSDQVSVEEGGPKIAMLLGMAYEYKNLLSPEVYKRLCNIGMSFIYNYGESFGEMIGLTSDEMFDEYASSIKSFDGFIENQEGDPKRIHYTLYDGHNFFGAGVCIEGSVRGRYLELMMWCSQYYPESYSNMMEDIIEFSDNHSFENLPEFIPVLFNGYVNNFTTHLAAKSVGTSVMNDALFGNETDDSKVIYILSEKGHYESMSARLDESKTDYEVDYWNSRLDAHDKQLELNKGISITN